MYYASSHWPFCFTKNPISLCLGFKIFKSIVFSVYYLARSWVRWQDLASRPFISIIALKSASQQQKLHPNNCNRFLCPILLRSRRTMKFDAIWLLIVFLFFDGCLSWRFIARETRPVHLDLYYESLCPDCSEFITTQLYPTWRKLLNTGIHLW
jgi:hypothetical protein